MTDEVRQFLYAWYRRHGLTNEEAKAKCVPLTTYRGKRLPREKLALLRETVLKRDGFRCRYCGVTKTEAFLTIDHVIPRSRGGTDRDDNLVAACVPCNQEKADRTPEEWGRALLQPGRTG